MYRRGGPRDGAPNTTAPCLRHDSVYADRLASRGSGRSRASSSSLPRSSPLQRRPSVQAPPLSPAVPDFAPIPAGTSLPGIVVPQHFPSPLLQRPVVLSRNISVGSTGFGSMYGSLYGNSSFSQQHSFYGNMGSFYAGFGDALNARPGNRGGDSLTPAASSSLSSPSIGSSSFMNAYPYGEGDDDTATRSANASPAIACEEDDTPLSRRGTAAARALRRKVSFSGLPPLTEEEESPQRTVALTPRRVGSRRLSAQRASHDGERNAPPPSVQPPPPPHRQPQPPSQQYAPIVVGGNSPAHRGFGSMYCQQPALSGYGANQSYGPYATNGRSWRPSYPSAPPTSSPRNSAQPQYNMYGGRSSAPFGNGGLVVMRPRLLMNGYYF
ncbi:hypothetical protein ABB37_02394 [Leptomonas pyrrhocoris]|uniref:Uncharacterized protein n=1 Tax=Leptomonas pyrrhocoris TaxID=157538 RepID=A0A0M9G7W9_LEPPY|nr:hypothetical protein ABB37_02394 [Leptomonas pyrrhocoris]KPA84417.1 hypothetical protein ABB37_02394 [Leptomonas pyrrhocoris]|eukprot:XP_015662856.1 hypothetical protein ABB37_02394 [Leptomonas pyrrhocoris]